MVTREDVIKDLQRVAEIVGRGPSLDEYREYGDTNTHNLYTHFEGLNEARAAAGLSNSDTRRAKSYTKKELIEAFERLRDELGRIPKREEMVSQGAYSEKPYRRVFGTWSKAVQEMGYEPYRPGEDVAEHAEKECAYCGEEFSRLASSFDESTENYFCSTECQDRHHEEHDGGEDHPLYNRVTVKCSWCGDELERKPSVVEKKEDFFCNRGDCYSQWCSHNRTGAEHPRFKGGRERYRGPNWRVQRRKARERDDHVCQMCGRTGAESQEEFGRALDVHHKTAVRDFRDSSEEVNWREVNALDNLVTLCLPCHRRVEKLPVTPQFD